MASFNRCKLGNHGLGAIRTGCTQQRTLGLEETEGIAELADRHPIGGENEPQRVGRRGGRGEMDVGSADFSATNGDKALRLEDDECFAHGRLAYAESLA